jgi:predicted NAD-dependent protein-ADP-ribosyltransferase YbiA (DUF1768 family)
MQRAPLATAGEDPYAVQLITRDPYNPYRCLSNAFRVSPPKVKRTSAEHSSEYDLEDENLPPEPGQRLSITGTNWKSVQHYLLAARFFHLPTDAHYDLLNLIEGAGTAEAACAIVKHALQPEVPPIRNTLVPEDADELCGKVHVREDWSTCAATHLNRALEVKFDVKVNLRICRRLLETCPGEVYSAIASDRTWAIIPGVDTSDPPTPPSFEAILLQHRARVAQLLKVEVDPEPEIAVKAPEPEDTSSSLRRCLSNSFMLPGLIVCGVEWKSLEHWLLAARFLDPTQVRDPAHLTLVACIHEAKTPQLARAIALFATFRKPPACRPAAIPPCIAGLRGKVYVRPDWPRVREHLLAQGLQAKFADKKQARVARRLMDTGLATFTCEERSRDANWYDTWEQATTPPLSVTSGDVGPPSKRRKAVAGKATHTDEPEEPIDLKPECPRGEEELPGTPKEQPKEQPKRSPLTKQQSLDQFLSPHKARSAAQQQGGEQPRELHEKAAASSPSSSSLTATTSAATPATPTAFPVWLVQMRSRLRNPRLNADDDRFRPWQCKPNRPSYWTEPVLQALRQKKHNQPNAAVSSPDTPPPPAQPKKRLQRPHAAPTTSDDDGDEAQPADATAARKKQKLVSTSTVVIPYRLWAPKLPDDVTHSREKTHLRMSHVRLSTITSGADLQRAFPPGTYHSTPVRDTTISIATDSKSTDHESRARQVLSELRHASSGLGITLGCVVEFPQARLHFGLVRGGLWCKLSKWTLEPEVESDAGDDDDEPTMSKK